MKWIDSNHLSPLFYYPAKDDGEALEKSRELALILNELYKSFKND